VVSARTRRSFAHSQVLAFHDPDGTIANLQHFLDLAKELKLPITLCDVKIVDFAVLETLVGKIGMPIRGEITPVLLLCGANLDEQVSLAAHHMLATGYDVRLIRDLVSVGSHELAHIHDLRLVQAGVVPITLKQLIYEWAAMEMDLSCRSILLKFRERLESIARPA
jgi:hypothetical protein